MARRYSSRRTYQRSAPRRKSSTGRRRVAGRSAQTVRLVFQAAPASSAPMVLPQGSQLVMPGAPRARKARF